METKNCVCGQAALLRPGSDICGGCEGKLPVTVPTNWNDLYPRVRGEWRQANLRQGS
jgi:hypothetical protein